MVQYKQTINCVKSSISVPGKQIRSSIQAIYSLSSNLDCQKLQSSSLIASHYYFHLRFIHILEDLPAEKAPAEEQLLWKNLIKLSENILDEILFNPNFLQHSWTAFSAIECFYVSKKLNKFYFAINKES